jgi:hypothetical protein
MGFWADHGWIITAGFYVWVYSIAVLAVWLLWRALTQGKWGSAILAMPLATYLVLLWVGLAGP